MLFVTGQLVRREYSFHPISGTSMNPVLTEKDMVLVKKRDPIRRYDIIAFSVKGEKGKFVKRVIGMPGDTMFIRNDRMVLNIGEQGEFETTYTFQLSPAVAEEFQALTEIPKGLYFTTGDHIDVSKDSRTFGFVQKKKWKERFSSIFLPWSESRRIVNEKDWPAGGEKMMVILGIVSAGLVGLAIIFAGIRLVFDWRLTEIQREPDQSLLFRRKLNHLRKIEQAQHIRYLLLTSLMIGLGVALTIGALLVLADNQQKMNLQNQKANERITQLENQQKQLIKSIPLKKYPEEGLGLTDYEWDKLVGDNPDSDLQKRFETIFSQKTTSYFGSSDMKVFLTEPKKLSLQLKGWTEDDTSTETVKQNIDAFAKEAEGISELMAVHVQLITSNKKNEKVVYSVNYSREKSEGVFHKKNVSEQNLKNDGGKG